MIIDSHTHIFGKEVQQERERYCVSDACFGLLYSNPRAKVLCVEDLINSMDEKGISKSVVLNIGWTSHDMCKRTNDYILESIARYPERLTGFCSVQPAGKEEALAEIERCSSAGAKGIGELRPDLQGYGLDAEEIMAPLVNSMMKHDMVLLLHASEPVGHAYAGKGSLTPEIIYGFIARHPDLRIVLAHFGGGLAFYELMPEVSKVLNNTCYDTAAAPFLYTPKIYKSLISIMGSGKILYGSDWPLLDPLRVVDHIRLAELGQNDLENVLQANASRLFGI
ncbi:MAG: amidohydrolase [Dehalococcoidia bacterium]|nr:MAG: amidohydrolase [Dehalococcoidia bacterium]